MMPKCLLGFAVLLMCLVVGGCSGDQETADGSPPPAGDNQPAADSNPQAADENRPLVGKKERAADHASPASLTAVDWLATYVPDDTTFVVLMDMSRAENAEPVLLQVWKSLDLERLLQLAEVEYLAMVFGQAANMETRMPQLAFLAKTKRPVGQETRAQLLSALRRLMEVPEVVAFNAVSDGNTLIVGTEDAVKQLNLKASTHPSMIKAIRGAGEHALTMHYIISPQVRVGAADELQHREEYANLLGLSNEMTGTTRLMRIQSLAESCTLTADVAPSLAVDVAAVPAEEAQRVEIETQARAMLETVRSTLADSRDLEQEPTAGVGAALKLLDSLTTEGKLTSEPGRVQFAWQAPPQPFDEFRAEFPALLAEGKANSILMGRQARLKQVANSMLMYSDRNSEQLPTDLKGADGTPLFSWRVGILSMLDYGDIYDQLRLDEPWDSEHNAKLLQQVDPRLFAVNPQTPDGHADLLAVIGKDLGFSPHEGPKPGGFTRADGSREFVYRSGTTIGGVSDGMAATALIVEVAPERSVPWAKPADYVWDAKQPTAGLGADSKPYFWVALGDTRVVRVSKQQDAETLRRLFTRNDGEEYKLEDVPLDSP